MRRAGSRQPAPVSGIEIRRIELRNVLLVGIVALACGATQAQGFETQPLPGLWEQQSQVLVDGQDMMAAMRQMQSQMLQALPPEQRAQAQAMMARQVGPSGRTRQCLSAQDVARWSDPKAALADAMKDQSTCTADLAPVSGNTLRFKVHCAKGEGMSGDFDGEFTVLDSKSWKYTMQGRGNMPQGMPGGARTVPIQVSGTGHWLAADCGKTR